ncbi:MAG: aminomethyltransferase family protein [Acidobacteriia bacterium]|nr:aminomethyltransferase family protein [Terriglobia bacterium]
MSSKVLLQSAHQALGATFGAWFGLALPEHYTSFAAEYRMAREAAVVLDVSYRAWFELTGPDRIRYLNAVVSNDTQALAPGQGTVALLLNPQGHILAELEAFAFPERYLISCHAPVRERTLQTLDRYIIMDDATLSDVSDQFVAMAIEGPATPGILKELCGFDAPPGPEFAHQHVEIAGANCLLIHRSEFRGTGVRLLVPAAQAEAVWQAALTAVRQHGGGPAGYAALNSLRLEAGVPWFGYDFDDTVIPHEAALESTHISFSKGCYTGQEIVERVRSRGHIRRKRVSLKIEGGIPGAKETLQAGGKAVGQVTSAAPSPALSAAVGMGYVRQEHFAPGSRLEWSGGIAEVIELPLRT